ncbi:MAG: ice-binding family protein [Minisyncoccia bacterium]
MKKIFSYVCLLAIAFLFVGVSINTAQAVAPGDVLINEFRLDGTQWIELFNTTDSDINLASSTWELVSTVSGPGSATSTLSAGLIPANGLLTVAASGLPTTAPTMLALNEGAVNIYTMSYGTPAFGAEPHFTGNLPSGQSAVLTGGTTWSATSTANITRGWYNESPAPTITSIVSDINTSNVATNMSTSSDNTAVTGLYFEKRTTLGNPATALGRLTFAGPLNLTNASTTALLQDLGTKMEAAAGSLSFDARTATDLRNAGASISMYNVENIGYDIDDLDISDLTVVDDLGVEIATSSIDYPSFSSISTSTDNSGTFTFTTSHFTGFEFDPIVTEVTPVTTPTASTSPYYTFSSNVVGTVIYGGDCATTSASTTVGNNIVQFGPLATFTTYSNCTVKVIDGAGASTTLAVTPFTISTLSANPAAVDLGTAGNYVVLAKSGITTTAGSSITGDIGASPISATAITGFDLSMHSSNTYSTSALITGKVYASNYTSPTPDILTTAIGDMETAYTDGAGRSADVTELGAGNIGGMTLTRGVYNWTTGVTIPTDLTLSGSATDVWIFQIAGDLDISSATDIILSGGALAKNIYWVVAGQTFINTTAVFNGNIICTNSLGLHLYTGATLNGRALSTFNVTLQSNIVTFPAESSAKDITAFTVPGQDGSTTISIASSTVNLTVPFGTNVTALVPTITITGASVSPASGIAHNFTASSTYTVTADDASTHDYTVKVTITSGLTDATITSATYTINNTDSTITSIARNTSMASFLAAIATSTGQNWNTSGLSSTINTGDTLVVTAQDGVTTKTYTLTVRTYSGSSSHTSTETPATTTTTTTTPSTTTTTTTTSTTHRFNTDLTLGSTGNDVVELQKALVAKGLLVMPAGVSMGYFGNLTRLALINYQLENGITPAVGYFGPLTRTSLNK